MTWGIRHFFVYDGMCQNQDIYLIIGLFHDEVGFSTQRQDEVESWIERVSGKFARNVSDILLYQADYQPSATSKSIITANPSMAPEVEECISLLICDSGMSSSTTT